MKDDHCCAGQHEDGLFYVGDFHIDRTLIKAIIYDTNFLYYCKKPIKDYETLNLYISCSTCYTTVCEISKLNFK